MTLAEPKSIKRLRSTHLVECYQADETVLVQTAARFLKDGLDLGHSLVVIATPGHRVAFVNELKRLGALSGSGWGAGDFILLDAADTLARLLVADEPDAARFDELVGRTIRDAMNREGARGVHAYGDMVGELWRRERHAAAVRLEGLWNDLRAEIDFDVFCAYPLDVFTEPFEANGVDAILNMHTHLMPSGANGHLEHALQRAFDEIIGANDGTLQKRITAFQQSAWARMPSAEAMIVWLRHTMPDRAPAILRRAQEYYQLAS